MFKMNFLRMRTESALKKNKTPRSSKSYKQAATVGVLFTVEDKQKHLDVKDFIQQLEREGKTVQVLEYLPEKKENFEFKFDFFTIGHLSFWGNLTSPQIEKFIETPFDYLFNIDKQPHPLILNLLARSKAHCRIGRYAEAGHPYFELMIEQNGTNKGLIETMYNYTKQLR
ncbi:MAG: hypothetical protein BroJett042_26160 [Bacteroidota bacterium]|nr:MAG: hypothetical protein BroJett042_26160 [Bacteroidota bacterium]